MGELEFLHEPLMFIVFGATLGVSVYSFRLLSKYFKGGVFEEPIKILSVFTTFFSIAILVDQIFLDWILEPMGIELIDAHNFHMIIEVIFFVGLFLSIHQMYIAWKKIEQG